MDTLSVLESVIDKNSVYEHMERLYSLINALVFCKKALSLTWFLGNVAIITMVLFGVVFYFTVNRKDNKRIWTFTRGSLPRYFYYFFSFASVVLMVFAKIYVGNVLVIAQLLLLGSISVLYWKRDILFHKEGRAVQSGWFIMLLIIGILQLFMFNTLPQMITIDEKANNLLHFIGTDADSVMQK